MPVIDDLQIKIQGDAVRANDAIDRLVGKLDRLTTSLGTLNSNSNLTNLSNGVQRLSSAMASMNNVKTADFTRLAKNIERLAMLDSSKINQAAGSVHQFANALNGLQAANMTTATQQIADLAKGIAQLGYKSSTKAITNIPQLAIAMRQLMMILSNAPKVSQNLIDMTNALAKLARTGAASGSAARSLSGALGTYTKSTSRATKGTWSLASAIGKLYATYWMLFRAFRLVGKAIDISSSLTEVQNVVDVTFGDMAKKIEKFSETSIEQFGMSELSVKKYASTFQAMGSAMGIDSALIGSANEFLNKQTNGYAGLSDSMADVSLNLTKLTADMASFYNVEQKDVADDLASVFTGSTRPLRQYGLDLTEATLKEWALKQGLDANIDSMSQAEKTMLRYQYVLANTGAAQGDFARTADTWANQVRILKQNFEQLGAVVGGTFINMLKPLIKALNAAMSHIIAFAKVVSNALGKIFGWTYEESGGGIAQDMEDAAGASDNIAGGMSDAEKAAKKLKSHLLSIDELNVLEPDTDGAGSGSGGSGSGGAGGGGATGGQWTKGESMFKQFESEIDTLYELGEKIGETLTKAMDSINWEKIYKKAEGFGRGLAQFLNGLISPELFGAVGRTIASSLNTAIYAALSFAKTFNFHEFGVSLATAVNEFFRTFDFQSLAEGLNEWVDGLKEAIKGFLKTISLTDIVNGIGGFLDELELDTVAVIIGAFVIKNNLKSLLALAIGKNLIKGITISSIPLMIENFAISGSPAFFVIGEQILTWIEEGISKILPQWAQDMIGNIVLGMSTGGLAGTAIPGIGTIAGMIIGALSSAFLTEIDGKTVLRHLLDPIFNFDRTIAVFDDVKKNFKKGGWYILLGIGEGILGALSFLTEPIGDLFSFVWETICGLFGIHSPAETMKPIGKNIILGVIEGFSLAYDSLSEKLREIWDLISEKFEEIKKTITEKITEAKNKVFEKFEEIRKTISDKINSAKETVSDVFDNIKKTISDKIDSVKTKLGEFKDSVDGVIKKIKDLFDYDGKSLGISLPTTIFNNFKTAIENAVNKLKELFGFNGKTVTINTKSEGVSATSGGFATGGYPQPATYFWAGENGVPEILGTVGGRTAVAGGAEITGIRDAVYDVGQSETALLRTAVSLLEVIASKNTSVKIDGRDIVNAYDERKARNGFSFT